MITISKDEAMMLQKKGFQFGSDLHRSYSRYKHYWATTSPKLMKTLNNYRNSIKNN